MQTHANHRRGAGGGGFSLVELLAVMAIIAVLFSLLMPAITRAREQASQVKCLSTLRDIGIAAQMHAVEHDGYLPTAGVQWNSVGGITNPHGLGDDGRRKYDYFRDEDVIRPLPITVALAHYLGVSPRTDSRENLEQDMHDSDGLRRLFRCPSQQAELLGWTQSGDSDGSWIAPDEFSSYAFNEALLGRREKPDTDRYPRGLLSRVSDPSHVFFALDGRPRDQQVNRFLLVFEFGDHDTLADFQQKILNTDHGRELLDFTRHRLRLNVVFVDGHAATVPMGLPPTGLGGNLDEVYVSRGLGL